MRKLLAAILAVFPLLAFPSSAFAQFGYVEGSVGFSFLSNVDSEDFAALTPIGLFEGNAQLDYNGNWAAGLEGGYMTGPWRFGVSWDYISSEVESAHLVGTLDGVPADFYQSDQELEDNFGISGNNDIHIFAVNAYYHFGGLGLGGAFVGIQPYIGGGLGLATHQDADSSFAFTGSLGANFAIGPAAYLGGRYRLGFVGNHTHDSGIDIESTWTHTFSLVIGYRFGV
jgi:hypothetical protein